jgi:DNA-binding Xre family transcriptional regulator
METRRIKIGDLPDLLAKNSGLNLTELAEEIDITTATLHNWKNGSVNKINYSVRDKLARALDKNKWGFRINKFIGDTLEVIYDSNPVDPTEEISYLHGKIDSLQGLINKLVNDNFILREKLEKYEVKK